MANNIVNYRAWVLKNEWIKMIASEWDTLNYNEKLGMLPLLYDLPPVENRSIPWLQWYELSASAQEKLLDLYGQSPNAAKKIQLNKPPLSIWQMMDTGQKMIQSPEGKENYSEKRWIELVDKYLQENRQNDV